MRVRLMWSRRSDELSCSPTVVVYEKSVETKEVFLLESKARPS